MRRPTLRNFLFSASTRPRQRISLHGLVPGRKGETPPVLRGFNHDIINDTRMQLPQEFHVGQNIAAAAILLQTLPEPQDLAQRDLHR